MVSVFCKVLERVSDCRCAAGHGKSRRRQKRRRDEGAPDLNDGGEDQGEEDASQQVLPGLGAEGGQNAARQDQVHNEVRQPLLERLAQQTPPEEHPHPHQQEEPPLELQETQDIHHFTLTPFSFSRW